MKPLYYINRSTGKVEEEAIYGQTALAYLYQNSKMATILRHFLAKNLWISSLAGWWQKQSWTRCKILSFIKKYQINTAEFLNPPETFESFNDFFIRKLKPTARPIDSHPNVAVMPADGRYFFLEDLSLDTPFNIKGKLLDLKSLLQDDILSKRFVGGSAVLARLCPTDYHRFHFPCDTTPSKPRLINGFLYSVNPIALKQNLSILWENKRVLTLLKTTPFGQVAMIEIGAMTVGSINQTHTHETFAQKGEEKGYFSFGGSFIVLLFEPKTIQFNHDLIKASQSDLEILCLMGESLGEST